MADISNRDDIIDSRDIEERIDELEAEQDGYIEDFESALEAAKDAADDWAAEDAAARAPFDPSGELNAEVIRAAQALADYWGDEPAAGQSITEHAEDLLSAFRDPEDGFLGNDELHALKAFRDEFENYCSDWRHGETLIRDSYFTEYAQELADDIGAINRDAAWPANCIDWAKAARELQMDYTSGEFDGVTYWARCG